MKKIGYLSLVILSMVSCDKIFKQNDVTEKADDQINELMGGEKDEHGCIVSAGYTWSEVTQNCIRVFEEGYRLNPINDLQEDENSSVISAFVVFDKEKTKAEIFLPQNDSGIVLEKKEEDIYANEQYKLDAKKYTLAVDDVIRFEAPKGGLKNIDPADDQEEEYLNLQ
ncbi:hypothetical protein QW060_20480 [Myroides ceti]|uniref:Lipoprotein n=1 Tax=Paenimyroides ceti TaxID=395087 RepID=A0ABT8CQU4_9FLAO|nr:hypothetical protein [Paenimyroides ceti]MDN3706730.1 hypothetical protein [Paenimyroides ceti]MDN3709389.1 hypothetical protein [Paenimyroides ceti]